MVEILQSSVFKDWLHHLSDITARAKVMVRIRRLAQGNPGDVKHVGNGISELRINYGPGYRVYYLQERDKLVFLLCGGDKRRQDHDIKRAKALARDWKDSTHDRT